MIESQIDTDDDKLMNFHTMDDKSPSEELLSTFFQGLINDVMNLNPNSFETLFKVMMETKSKDENADKTWSTLKNIYENLLERICAGEEQPITAKLEKKEKPVDNDIESILTEDFVLKNEDFVLKNESDTGDAAPLNDYKVEKLVNDLKTEYIFPELLREINSMKASKMGNSESLVFIKDVLEILKETRNLSTTKRITPLEKIEEEVDSNTQTSHATSATSKKISKVSPTETIQNSTLKICNLQLTEYKELIDTSPKPIDQFSISEIDFVDICSTDIENDITPSEEDKIQSNSPNRTAEHSNHLKSVEVEQSAAKEEVGFTLESMERHSNTVKTNSESELSPSESITELAVVDALNRTISVETLDKFIEPPSEELKQDVSSSDVIKATSKSMADETKSNEPPHSSNGERVLTTLRSKSTPSLRASNTEVLPDEPVFDNVKMETSKKTDEPVLAPIMANNEKLVINSEITNVLKSAKNPQQMVEKLKLLANKINLYNYDKQYHATLKKLNDIKEKLGNQKSKRYLNLVKSGGVTDVSSLTDLKKCGKNRTINMLKQHHQFSESDMILPKTKYIAKRLEIKSDPSEMKCRVRLVLSEVKNRHNRKDSDEVNETNFINQETTARLRQIFKNFKQIESPKVVITSSKINDTEREKLMKSVPQFINNILLKDDRSKIPEKPVTRQQMRPSSNFKGIKAPKKTSSHSETDVETNVDSSKSQETDLQSLGSLTQLPAYSFLRPVHYDLPEPADPKFVTSETKLLRSITADIIQPIKSEYTKEVQLASVKPIATTKSNTAVEVPSNQEVILKKSNCTDKLPVKFKRSSNSSNTPISPKPVEANNEELASVLTFRDVIQLKILANNLTNYFRRSGRSFDTIIPLTIKSLYNRGVGLTRYQNDKWKYHNSKNSLFSTRFSDITHIRTTATYPIVDLSKKSTVQPDDNKKVERSVRFSPELVTKIEKATVPETGSVKTVLRTLNRVLDDVTWDGKSERNDTPTFNEIDIIGKLSASTVEDSFTVNLEDLITPSSGDSQRFWSSSQQKSEFICNRPAMGKVDL